MRPKGRLCVKRSYGPTNPLSSIPESGKGRGELGLSAGTTMRGLLLLLFDAFTNKRSDLFIREINDGLATSGFSLSVRSLRNQ